MPASKIVLRDYQEVAFGEIRVLFKDKKYPVLFVLPTGGGKTYTFSAIAASAAERGGVVFIIVHRKELLLQASASLSALGIPHGLISPAFTPTPGLKVQVASVDTLLIRLKDPKFLERYGQPKLLIFDEAHHVVESNKWGRCYVQLNKPAMLGVTATPVRTDGKGLGEAFGGVFKAMVLGPSVAELIQRGMLLDPVVYTSLEMPDLSGLKTTTKGDYNPTELAARVDKPKITGSAVEHYKKLCPGRRAIVFCSSIKHAQHVRDEFNAAGFKFELLVGEPEMSDAERTAVNKRLRRGEIHGACTVDLVSEGYDLPDLEVCIMLRPTASEALFLQQVGRVMRISDGKTICWLLDHVGNVGARIDGTFKRKHGLPNEEREWTLEGRKKKKKGAAKDEPTIPLKQCPTCYAVHAPAPECPACGYEYPNQGRQVEQVDGELTLVTQDMAAEMKAARAMAVKKAKTLAELEKIEQDRGYKPGWAQHIFSTRAKTRDKYRRPEPPIEAYFSDR